jgi:hypothetical protein
MTQHVPQTKVSDDAATDAAWRGFVTRFIAVFAGALAVVLCFIVLVDPYDSGRFPGIGLVGISDTTQRTENVSLGRSSRFDAAVFGNSHGQLIDPERLTQLTGLSFVQLAIPGADAPEQLAMLHWFIRHHPRIGALVLATDERWCSDNPQPWKWFPFWLYGDSDFQYLVNSLNSRSAGAAVRRIKHALGLLHPSDPRGYDDYERGIGPGYKFDFPAPEPPPAFDIARIDLGNRSFPAIDRLAAQLAAVPADTAIVILFPPQHYSTLPRDAPAAALLAACKARLARLVAGVPRRGFLDFLVDSPLTRDDANFDDLEHYRARVARQLEAAIAGVIKGAAANR